MLPLAIEERIRKGDFRLVYTYLSYIRGKPDFIRLGIINKLKIIEFIKDTHPSESKNLWEDVVNKMDHSIPGSVFMRVWDLGKALGIDVNEKLSGLKTKIIGK